MKTRSKVIMTTFAISALILPGQALAMESASSANVAVQSVVQPTALIKTISPKRKIRIVRAPLPKHTQATRTDTDGRFVIATDVSKDTMRVFKAVKQSKSMPNLFKN